MSKHKHVKCEPRESEDGVPDRVRSMRIELFMDGIKTDSPVHFLKLCSAQVSITEPVALENVQAVQDVAHVLLYEALHTHWDEIAREVLWHGHTPGKVYT